VNEVNPWEQKSKASRNVTAYERLLDRAEVPSSRTSGDGRAFHRSIPSAAWRPFHTDGFSIRPRGWRPIALRRRLSTGLPFRGWKAFDPGRDVSACLQNRRKNRRPRLLLEP